MAVSYRLCFTTLWIYTILKPTVINPFEKGGFTTLWIYTILKRKGVKKMKVEVSLPYGFTLFSNMANSQPT